MELSWTTVHGATRYELLVWDSVNDWRQIGGDSLTGTTYTHSDLVAGTTYFYTISAANADGETSAWSDYVSTATATATPTHTPTATATATHTPAATTGQPSDSSAACCCRSYAHSVANGCRPCCAGVDGAGVGGRRGTQLDHRTRRYALRTLGVGQCQRLASDWRRQPHRHNLHAQRPRRRHHLLLHHQCSQRRRRNKRVVRLCVHGDGDSDTYSHAYGHGDSHTYACSHDRSTQRFQCRLLPPNLRPQRRQRLPPLLRRC